MLKTDHLRQPAPNSYDSAGENSPCRGLQRVATKRWRSASDRDFSK